VESDRFPQHKESHFHKNEHHHHKKEEHHHHNYIYNSENKGHQGGSGAKLNMKIELMREVEENKKMMTN
jgi:hypothetical protein